MTYPLIEQHAQHLRPELKEIFDNLISGEKVALGELQAVLTGLYEIIFGTKSLPEWLHKASGGKYLIEQLVFNTTTNTIDVLYTPRVFGSLTTPRLWATPQFTRSLDDFLTPGKFSLIE